MKGIVSMRNLRCSLLLWFGVMTTLAAEEFDRVVAPFFKAHCVKCHGQDGKVKGKVNLLPFKTLADMQARPVLLEDMIAVLEDREMPPEDEPAMQAAAPRKIASTAARNAMCNSMFSRKKI